MNRIANYILGVCKNIFNPAVSIRCKIDNLSNVDKHANIGANTQVFRSSVGKYTYVGKNSRLVYAEIGNFCSIADGTLIGLSNHTIGNISTSPIFTEPTNATGKQWTKKDVGAKQKKVVIGNDVWIGSGVIINSNVCIGDGSIIGAGAVVTKNIPPYAIVAGVPAKIIRFRFSEDVILYLLQLKWWNYPDRILKTHIEFFQQENITVNMLEELKLKMNKF